MDNYLKHFKSMNQAAIFNYTLLDHRNASRKLSLNPFKSSKIYHQTTLLFHPLKSGNYFVSYEDTLTEMTNNEHKLELLSLVTKVMNEFDLKPLATSKE